MLASRRALLRAAGAVVGGAGLARVLPARAAGFAEIRPFTGATPPLTLKDAGRREHRLADYRGRVVLVNFWATWCEPCRDEMPSIERLAERMQGRPFTVLAVNLGESEANAKRFMEGAVLHPERMTVLFDHDMAVARRWGATLLPASYLIDTTGRARHRVRGEADWSGGEYLKAVESLLPKA